MVSRIFCNYESTIFSKKLSLFIYSYVLLMEKTTFIFVRKYCRFLVTEFVNYLMNSIENGKILKICLKRYLKKIPTQKNYLWIEDNGGGLFVIITLTGSQPTHTEKGQNGEKPHLKSKKHCIKVPE